MAESPFESPPPRGRERWWWSVSTIAALASLVLGLIAFVWIGGDPGIWRFFEAFYSGAELLILHFPGEYMAQHQNQFPTAVLLLHLARIFAFVAVTSTGIALVLQFFKEELRLQFARRHVVICGLGDVGLRLATRAPGRFRRPVVAIEKSCPNAVRELLRHHGVILIDGDATEQKQLAAAKADQAEFVVATCGDDQTNIAVAATVGKLVPSTNGGGSHLVCRTLIRNPATRLLLSRHDFFGDNQPGYRVNFNDLDRHAVAARLALRDHPLDFRPILERDNTEVRLVVIGFGIVGQSLALHAAQIGHFANEVDATGKTKQRLSLIVVNASEACVDEFRARYAQIDRVIDMCVKDPPPKSDFVSWLADLSQPQTPTTPLVTYAFCWEGETGDDRNFQFGAELSEVVKDRRAQTLIYQRTRKGFSALLEDNRGTAAAGRLHPYGMIEDVFDWQVLVHEEQDKLAKALHENYCRKRSEPQPAWELISDELRDSNRQAADHIPIKLRALSYHQERLREPSHNDSARITSFTQPEVDLLSKMEHSRWCAERFLGGWRYVDPKTTDRASKVNRCLVDWCDVPPEEQKKDLEQIHAISQVLFDIGYGIYR